jgi:hypothetical protein
VVRIYVANCTLQNRTLNYRTDYDDRSVEPTRSRFLLPKSQPIASGRQQPLGGTDFMAQQVDDIVGQIQRLGGVLVLEVAKLKRYAPYVINVGAPVPARIMEQVAKINSSVKMAEGRERRKNAAIAGSATLSMKIEAPVPEYTVEIEQLDVSEADETPITEGYIVKSADAGPTKGGRGKARGGLRKAA